MKAKQNITLILTIVIIITVLYRQQNIQGKYSAVIMSLKGRSGEHN